MKKVIAATAALALLLCGCTSQLPGLTQGSPPQSQESQAQQETGAAVPPATESLENLDAESFFSDRDYEVGYNAEESIRISLNGGSAACEDSSVQISGSIVTLTQEGTYVLSGKLDDGMIVVDAPKEDKLQLVFAGVSIHSEDCAALYIKQADKVFLTLDADTDNSLSNGGSFVPLDENNIDAVIFSKEDLTLNGSGKLSIASPGGHGIVSKDELTVTSGTYGVVSASHGLCGKDSVCIANAAMTIQSGKDGIQADNDEDAAMGYFYAASGTFHITAEGDGISASGQMQIDGGTYTITTGGGSANASTQTSGGWGGMGGRPGGGGHGGGGPGGQGGWGGNSGGTTEEEDSTSIKGLKSSGQMLINGGAFTIDSADDAVHANSDLTVASGSFTIASGDDGFHADEKLLISNGNVLISKSYEGLEGLSVEISGGDISAVSSDDGINAAGGTDQSGFGGFRGGDKFGGTSSSDSHIVISGGKISIQASGDGVDSNGDLSISGGGLTICGPTSGDTAVLDFETSGVITGGTFIGTGALQMAQTFTESQQGVIALRVGSQSAGTTVTLKDTDGNVLISYEPPLDYQIIILSTPEMSKGQTYTVTVGDYSGEYEAY